MSKSSAGLGQDRTRATRMNPVVQGEATGCGIASVAMLAGVTYQHAKKAAAQLGIQVSNSRLWSDTALVCRLPEHYGIIAEQSLKNSRFVPGIHFPRLPSLLLNDAAKDTARVGIGWYSGEKAAGLSSSIPKNFSRTISARILEETGRDELSRFMQHHPWDILPPPKGN